MEMVDRLGFQFRSFHSSTPALIVERVLSATLFLFSRLKRDGVESCRLALSL